MQVLLYNINNDTDRDNTIESYDPLTLLKLIEKKYLIRQNINIAMQQCTINSMHCMDWINTTWLMNSIMRNLIQMLMLENLPV